MGSGANVRRSQERQMTNQSIKNWLSYWNAAGMVAIDQINAFDQVYQARKFCQCMRVGVFADVSDLQIWNALRDMRA
jgi:hypothetical protein